MRSRVVAIVAGAASTGLLACGFLGIDFMPVDANGADAAFADGSDDGSASDDTGGGSDAPFLDAGQDAGRCVGPNCPGVVYVSSAVGLDTNPGTGALPMKTIGAALVRAQATAATALYVAGGNYAESVRMVEGISIAGGFSCSAAPCSWDWDIVQYATIIADQTTDGLVADRTITQATVLDGVEVNAVANNTTATTAIGISVTGSPTIQRCAVVGAQNTQKSIGILITAPATPKDPRGPVIVGTVVGARAATLTSTAIEITPTTNTPLNATIVGNRLEAKSGNHSYGIAVYAGASVNIVGNHIFAGGSDGSGGEPDSWGIASYGAALTIERNWINTDASGATHASCAGKELWCGGVLVSDGTAVVRSNAIRGATPGRSAAVRLVKTTSSGVADSVINGNALDGEGGNAASAAVVISSATSLTFGDVRNNILGPGTGDQRYGVFEDVTTDGVTVHLSALDNNYFFDTGGTANEYAYRYWTGSGEQDIPFTQVGSVTPAPVANVSGGNPYIVFPHVLTTSGVIDKGTTVRAAPKDIDGDDRLPGNPVDIGADEAK